MQAFQVNIFLLKHYLKILFLLEIMTFIEDNLIRSEIMMMMTIIIIIIIIIILNNK